MEEAHASDTSDGIDDAYSITSPSTDYITTTPIPKQGMASSDASTTSTSSPADFTTTPIPHSKKKQRMFSYSPAVVVLPPMLANAKLEDVILGWAKVLKTGALLVDAKGNNVRTAETINGVEFSTIRAKMLWMMCAMWTLKNSEVRALTRCIR